MKPRPLRGKYDLLPPAGFLARAVTASAISQCSRLASDRRDVLPGAIRSPPHCSCAPPCRVYLRRLQRIIRPLTPERWRRTLAVPRHGAKRSCACERRVLSPADEPPPPMLRSPEPRLLRGIRFPDKVQPIGAIHVTPSGCVWVRRGSVDDGPALLHVHAPNGAVVAGVAFPSPPHVLRDGNLYVLEIAPGGSTRIAAYAWCSAAGLERIQRREGVCSCGG